MAGVQDVVGTTELEDGSVDGEDLIMWQGAYGLTDAGDADEDGDTDGRDYLTWQRQFGTLPLSAATASGAVPEPSSVVMAAFAALVWVGRRR